MTSRTRRERTNSPPKAPTSAPVTPSAPPTARPFKPHPILFAVLMLLFMVWVSILLIMYFKTVYPRRHPATPATASSVMFQ